MTSQLGQNLYKKQTQDYDKFTVPVEQLREFYTWEPHDRGFSVHLDLGVIDRLGVEVMRGFGAVRRRGAEVGGLLLGTIERKGEQQREVVVSIQDFAPVPCEYAQGPSYLLSSHDHARFRELVDRWKPGSRNELYAVGFYRSHTRDGLALGDEDLSLYAQYFSDPAAVVLLIRPYATKASMAAFFYQEEGVLSPVASQLEFPFRRSELPSTSAVSVPRVPSDAGTAPTNTGPLYSKTAPLSAKTESPSAKTEPPPTKTDPAPTETGLPRARPGGLSPRPGEPLQTDTPMTGWRPEKTRATPIAPAEAAPEKPEIPKKIAAPERTAPRPPLFTPESPRPAVYESRPLFAGVQPQPSLWYSVPAWTAFLAALLLLGAVAGHQYAGGRLVPFTRIAAPDPYALKLSVEPTEGNMLIRWDSDSMAVRNAWRGLLTITVAGDNQVVQMDVPQLRNGSVLYRHVAPEVSFRLEVFLNERRSVVETLSWQMQPKD
ncbi:MAG: hypothetical protein ACRD7E_10290 [Bryobacteraceae bacterium]